MIPVPEVSGAGIECPYTRRRSVASVQSASLQAETLMFVDAKDVSVKESCVNIKVTLLAPVGAMIHSHVSCPSNIDLGSFKGPSEITPELDVKDLCSRHDAAGDGPAWNARRLIRFECLSMPRAKLLEATTNATEPSSQEADSAGFIQASRENPDVPASFFIPFFSPLQNDSQPVVLPSSCRHALPIFAAGLMSEDALGPITGCLHPFPSQRPNPSEFPSLMNIGSL